AGKVRSAGGIRSGQPRAQYIPGTGRVTSVGTAGGFDPLQPIMAIPKRNRSRAKEKRERIAKSLCGEGSAAGVNDAALETLFGDRLQHPLGRDLVGVVGDVEQVFLKIDVDATDTRKP